MHQMFQSNLIFRIPTMSLSPWHVSLDEMVFPWRTSARSLRVIATQHKNNWTTITTFLFPFVLCLYLLLNGHQWLFITHCFHHPRLEVGTKLPRWCFWTMVNVVRHVNHSSRLPRALSDWFPSFGSQVRHYCLRYWPHGVHADDGDAECGWRCWYSQSSY